MSDWQNRGNIALIQRQPPRGKSFIRVGLSGFGDKTFVDIREYYKDEEGILKPTKKGITINAYCIEPVIKSLCLAARFMGIAISGTILPVPSDTPAASNQ